MALRLHGRVCLDGRRLVAQGVAAARCLAQVLRVMCFARWCSRQLLVSLALLGCHAVMALRLRAPDMRRGRDGSIKVVWVDFLLCLGRHRADGGNAKREHQGRYSQRLHVHLLGEIASQLDRRKMGANFRPGSKKFFSAMDTASC